MKSFFQTTDLPLPGSFPGTTRTGKGPWGKRHFWHGTKVMSPLGLFLEQQWRHGEPHKRPPSAKSVPSRDTREEDMGLPMITQLTGFVTAHWFTVAAATIVPLLLYFFGTRETRKLKATFGDMPGPKPWPFLGGLPDGMKFKGQLHLQIDHYYKKYGRVFCSSFLGTPTLLTGDPEMVKQILVKDFDSFYDRVVSIGGVGIWKTVAERARPER